MNASRVAAIVLAVLLLAYPLSVGPGYRWQLGHGIKDYKQLPPSVQAFYWPLSEICKVRAFKKAAWKYTLLWLPEDAIESYGLRKAINDI